MLAKERQDMIFTWIQEQGAVNTSELVKRLRVSIETVRRDLLTMEQQGQLSRVHGGAVARSGMRAFNDLHQRNSENTAQKLSLAHRAADFINEGDVIGVDSGSTAIHFAQVLKERFQRLTVITHSLDVFELLQGHREFSVILCGGHYLNAERAFYGPLVLQAIQSLHVQKLFLFPSAVSLSGGICDFQSQLYIVQQQLIRIADRVFILADSSKFEQTALLKLDDIKSGYIYITDGDFAPQLAALYADNHIEIFKGDPLP